MIVERTVATQLKTLQLILVCFVALISNRLSTGYIQNLGTMKLEMVQVLFRHGERAPQRIEHNILNYLDESAYEPFGLDQLTNTGKMQAYRIGQMLRERYKDFLNNRYDSRNVDARSSENERTKMTLQLVLAGLFPPTKDLKWHPKLDWMPIAYRYVPADIDALLKTQLTFKFDQIYLNVWKTPWGKDKMAMYKDIYDLIEEKLDVKLRKNQITDMAVLHNILLIHERLNLPLPEWYTKKMKSRFEEAFEIFHDSQSFTTQMKRLNGGPLVRTFVNNMNLDNSVENPKKLYLYSGHDLNVGAVIRALNVHGFGDSDFCSTLILEKWKDSKNQVHVRLLHWNGVREEISTARFEGCEEFCPIDKFLELTRDVIPSDEELFSLFDQYDIDYVKNNFP